MATKYRLSILAAFFCSIMVGVLWGGSISALYPVVEIVFRGESLHDWAEQRIKNDQSHRAEIATEIRNLEAEGLQADADGRSKADADHELILKQTALSSAETQLERSRMFQKYIRAYLPDNPFQNLLVVVVFVVLLTVLKSVFLVFNMMLVARICALTSYNLQNQLFENTLHEDLATFNKNGTSGILSVFTHNMRVLEAGIGAFFGKAIREPLKMVACLVGAALISWQLLLLCLALTPVGFAVLWWLSRAMKKSSGTNLDVVKEIYLRLSESFNCIKAVKAFTTEDYEQERFRVTGRVFVYHKLRMALFRSLFRPATEITGMVVIGMAILFGAYLVLNHRTEIFGLSMGSRPLSPGALVVFFGMLAGIADPIRKMSDIYGSIIAATSAADRVYLWMDRTPKIRDPEKPHTLARPHQELYFQNVNFHYRGNEPVLKNIDLRIPFGQTVVFMGPNGCGKSTLLNLVPRFFDPVRGTVRMDDISLRDAQLYDLRNRISVVTQETLLFADTIANNIRYGMPDASDEMVIDAAKQAHAHEFIEQMSSGYDTFVGKDGGQLSGGQRQRISLARAILRDPEILILDEATSQIDIESERQMHDTLQHFVKGRTALIASHRLATLSIADRIIVMEDGQVSADGSHQELQKHCEQYRRLHESPERKTAA